MNRNFLQAYRYILGGVAIFSVFIFGTTSYIFAQIIPSVDVSFSVSTTDIIDCTELLHPKTKVLFTASPTAGGFFYLSSIAGSRLVDPGTLSLNNGSYTWYAKTNSGYSGTGLVQEGSFTLSATCPTSLTTTSGTSTTTATTTSTPTVPIITSFSVIPTEIVNCLEPLSPKTKTYFSISPSDGGFFSISRDNGVTYTQLGAGEKMVPNGSYVWHAVTKELYVAELPSSGAFILNSTCVTNSYDVATSTVTTQIQNENTTINTTPHNTTEDIIPVTIDSTATIAGEIFTVNLQFGSTGPQVRILQELLVREHILYLDGLVSGFYGPLTQAAVGRLQEKYGLGDRSTPGYGDVGVTTRKVLNDLYIKMGGGAANTAMYLSDLSNISYQSGTKLIGTKAPITQTQPKTIDATPAYAAKPLPSEVQNFAANHTNIFGEMTFEEILKATSEQEENKILTRINDAASCRNPKECAVYCAQKNTRGVGACAVFVDPPIIPHDSEKSSLLKNINTVGIKNILEDMGKRPARIPEAVKNTDDFEQFCLDTKNIEVCSDVLVAGNLASKETLENFKAQAEQVYQQEKKVLIERVGARVFVDSDNDGVSNYDETNIYRTNPRAKDTDKDGVSDGEEIILRTNPIDSKKAVVFANESQKNPLVSGILEPALLTVKEVRASNTATSTEGVLIPKSITFKGTGIPNSFVTLYIYSEPTVVTLKTNAYGEWAYTLDSELADGTHQVISTITGAGGRVLAKSEPFRFVKVAQAITVGGIELEVPVASKEPGFFAGSSLYVFIAMIIGIVGLGFLVIGFMAKNRPDDGAHIV